MKYVNFKSVAVSFLMLNVLLGQGAHGQTPAFSSSQTLTKPESTFDVFVPQRQTMHAVLDYDILDAALDGLVLRMGESIRVRARRPVATVGTSLIGGHKTAYRLEGSRVTFSYMDDEFKRELSAYRVDLVRIANRVKLTEFSRKEQLAFWFNLHNVLVIEQIALNYPTRRPSELELGLNKKLFHDAKLIEIKGVALSLRDIRQNIVYKNWSNPWVIYGFFHGDIGGPALQNYAITGKNVNTVLSMHAHEFINSLRGFHSERKTRNVSAIYSEARPYYFKNWDADLSNHLAKHATPDVLEDVLNQKPLKIDNYDTMIADLLGGNMAMPTYVSGPDGLAGNIPPEVNRLLKELHEKAVVMRRRGMLNQGGVVIIEDIETIDPDAAQDAYDENEEGSLATPK